MNQSPSSQSESASTPPSQFSVPTGGKPSINHYGNIDIKECVKIRIFPVAKFLRLEDLPYTDHLSKQSWCRKMAQWCNIDQSQVTMWWEPAKKIITHELGLQRSTKSNKIKAAFFGKHSNLHLIFRCHC